jgi:peptidoglycan-associated lipoprotein
MKPGRSTILLLALMLIGCGSLPKNVVVLLDDESGRSSALIVTNAGGTTMVDRPLTSVDLDEPASPSGQPVPVDEAAVRKAFGAALAATPRQPQHFTLYFPPDSAALTPEITTQLVAVIAAAKAFEMPDIGISGHTDRTGSVRGNERLSLRRAEAVRLRLIDAGIPPENIRVSWHGPNNPLVETSGKVPEPRNRRDEVTIR